jgi:DNA-binding response OmpR family regulator
MENKRILVIDDDNFVRALVCKGLRSWGYGVTEAANGEQGMRLVETETPDLVITDIVMPQKDGLETIMELRKKCPGIKVIAISGAGYGWGGDYLAMSHKLGSDAVFPKPVDMKELEKTISHLLSQPPSGMTGIHEPSHLGGK